VSEENVEVMRRAYEVMNRAGLDAAVVQFAHPEIEFVPPPDLPTGAVRGIEAVAEFARQWVKTFDDFRIEPERFIDPGGEQVVVFVRDSGRVKGSGAEIHNRFVHVWTLGAGKVIKWQTFTDESRALEAAGLSE
jgi:ketosteroid isomerase-like protein